MEWPSRSYIIYSYVRTYTTTVILNIKCLVGEFCIIIINKYTYFFRLLFAVVCCVSCFTSYSLKLTWLRLGLVLRTTDFALRGTLCCVCYLHHRFYNIIYWKTIKTKIWMKILYRYIHECLNSANISITIILCVPITNIWKNECFFSALWKRWESKKFSFMVSAHNFIQKIILLWYSLLSENIQFVNFIYHNVGC